MTRNVKRKILVLICSITGALEHMHMDDARSLRSFDVEVHAEMFDACAVDFDA